MIWVARMRAVGAGIGLMAAGETALGVIVLIAAVIPMATSYLVRRHRSSRVALG
jgi:hypothetical protein